MRSALLFVVLSACSAPATPLASDVVAAAASPPRLRLQGDSFSDIQIVEPDAPGVSYPTLGALAAADEWGIAPCASDVCANVVEAGRAEGFARVADPVARKHGPRIDELRVVGVDGQHVRECTWRLVARTAQGWITPLVLGVSAKGCTVPYDADLVGSNALWFPRSITSDAHGMRLEGQSTDRDLYVEDLDAEVDLTLTRVVVSCRVGASGEDTVACSRHIGPGRDFKGPAKAMFALPRLPMDPHVAPLTDLQEVGRTTVAEWMSSPVEPDLLGTLVRYGALRVETAPLGEATLIMTAHDAWMRLVVLHDGVARVIASRASDAENERLEVGPLVVRGDVVTVPLARINRGDITLESRWVEVVTPTLQARFATGIALKSGESTSSSWRRDVVADVDGVTLSAASEGLAWFRGTGRFTWGELPSVLARWSSQLDQALDAAATHEVPRGRSPDPNDRVATLRTLPGFAEPLDRPLVDELRRY